MSVRKTRKYETLTDWVRDKGGAITVPVSHVLGNLGVHPNTVTVIGFLLNLAAGAVLASGRTTWGAVGVAVASAVDGFDGALARTTGKKSQFGAFLDSTLDRVSEAALFFGLLVWFVRQGMQVETYLLYLVAVGSIMVSYTRARAEGLGLECKVGLLTRLERMALLCLGLLFGWIRLTLILMAGLSWFTFAQRFYTVYRVSRAVSASSV